MSGFSHCEHCGTTIPTGRHHNCGKKWQLRARAWKMSAKRWKEESDHISPIVARQSDEVLSLDTALWSLIGRKEAWKACAKRWRKTADHLGTCLADYETGGEFECCEALRRELDDMNKTVAGPHPLEAERDNLLKELDQWREFFDAAYKDSEYFHAKCNDLDRELKRVDVHFRSEQEDNDRLTDLANEYRVERDQAKESLIRSEQYGDNADAEVVRFKHKATQAEHELSLARTAHGDYCLGVALLEQDKRNALKAERDQALSRVRDLWPHTTRTPDGEVCVEWWNEKRKLTVYFGDSPMGFRVWGPDIDNEMQEFKPEGKEMREAWEWLTE